MTFEITTEGRYLQPNVKDPWWVCPDEPEGMVNIKCEKFPGIDPFPYSPLGDVGLSVGDKVMITTFDKSGEWAWGWVQKKIPHSGGMPHSAYMIGSQHQLQLEFL